MTSTGSGLGACFDSSSYSRTNVISVPPDMGQEEEGCHTVEVFTVLNGVAEHSVLYSHKPRAHSMLDLKQVRSSHGI